MIAVEALHFVTVVLVFRFGLPHAFVECFLETGHLLIHRNLGKDRDGGEVEQCLRERHQHACRGEALGQSLYCSLLGGARDHALPLLLVQQGFVLHCGPHCVPLAPPDALCGGVLACGADAE